MRWFIMTMLASLCGLAKAKVFEIYSCPLGSSVSILSSGGSKDCSSQGSSSQRDILHVPYGIRHTYLKIDSTCYDWGDWNYVNHIPCSSQSMGCCVKTAVLEFTGDTRCADRISDFEAAWTRTKKPYNVLHWNCQVYTDAMKDFLTNCYVNAASAIPQEHLTKYQTYVG